MPSQSREKQLLKIREERSHTQLFFFFLDGSVISVFVAPGESRMKEQKGVVTATTTSRRLELETTLNELEQKITVEKCKQPVRLTREQIRTYYGKALKLEPQLLISYLVRRIVLFDDRAEIEYNTPIDTTPGDGRGILLDTIGRDYTAYSVANEGRQVTKHMDIDIKI